MAGQRHGRGTLVLASGLLYDGQFADNCMEGRGTCTYPNKSVCVGCTRLSGCAVLAVLCWLAVLAVLAVLAGFCLFRSRVLGVVWGREDGGPAQFVKSLPDTSLHHPCPVSTATMGSGGLG